MAVFDQLVILGVGLMGGSLALAAKQSGAVNTVVGWSRRQTTLQSALDLGVIDRAESELADALRGASCVVVATPTMLAEKLMIDVLENVPSQVVVTDVASVKGNIAAALSRHFGSVPSNVVLGHPIAGSERSGVAAANADLYCDHHVILTTDEQTDADALAAVRQLWQSVGADVFAMSTAEHDRVLALTSHLPHLLAYALVSQLSSGKDASEVFQFAAGGFRDFTRIASSDPVMWREILFANKQQVLAGLDSYEQQLSQLRSLLESGSGEELEQIFVDAKRSRDAFAEQLLQRKSK